jgi:hypothetical protein
MQQRVTADYLQYLGRSLNPVERDGWASWAFANGLRNEDVIGGIVGSQEYFGLPTKGKNDPTGAAWLISAIQDILQRPINLNDEGWLNALASPNG